MFPVIFETGLVAPEQGNYRAVRIDSQVLLYRQMVVRLIGDREMASVADLDQQAQECGHRTSKSWAKIMGLQ